MFHMGSSEHRVPRTPMDYHDFPVNLLYTYILYTYTYIVYIYICVCLEFRLGTGYRRWKLWKKYIWVLHWWVHQCALVLTPWRERCFAPLARLWFQPRLAGGHWWTSFPSRKFLAKWSARKHLETNWGFKNSVWYGRFTWLSRQFPCIVPHLGHTRWSLQAFWGGRRNHIRKLWNHSGQPKFIQHVLQFRYESKEIWIPNHFFGSPNMLLQRVSFMGGFPQCVLEHVVHECEKWTRRYRNPEVDSLSSKFPISIKTCE